MLGDTGGEPCIVWKQLRQSIAIAKMPHDGNHNKNNAIFVRLQNDVVK